MAKDNSSREPKHAGKERILQAARDLFFSRGFSAVTTEQLVSQAGVSKATLYKHFEGLADVLRVMILNEVDQFNVGVEQHPESRAEWLQAIEDFGTNLLTFLNTAEAQRLDRLMLEEARDHPDIARVFFKSAYLDTEERLKSLINFGVDKSWTAKDVRSADLAEQLTGMWKGNRYPRAQFSLTEKPFKSPRKWAKACVDSIFSTT